MLIFDASIFFGFKKINKVQIRGKGICNGYFEVVQKSTLLFGKIEINTHLSVYKSTTRVKPPYTPLRREYNKQIDLLVSSDLTSP